jgi:hypothetical protein
LGEQRYAYKVLVIKPERRRQLGRPKHKWKAILKSIILIYDVTF